MEAVFFLLLIIFSVNSSIAGGARDIVSKSSKTDFIKTSCSATTYPKLCFSSLSSKANKIQTSPQLLVVTAIDIALSSTSSASDTMANLLKTKGLKLKSKDMGAMDDCVEELGDSIDELKSCVSEMGKLRFVRGSDLELTVNNIETWISGALTDQNTCMEAFDGESLEGDDDDRINVKMVVRKEIEKIAHLTSNALALVNQYVDRIHDHDWSD